MYHPEKTAIKRNKMTKPTEWLFLEALPSLDLHPSSVLDYGAGKSVDVDLLLNLVIVWSPVRGIRILTWDLNTVRLDWHLVGTVMVNWSERPGHRGGAPRRRAAGLVLACARGLLWLCTFEAAHRPTGPRKAGQGRQTGLSGPSKRTVSSAWIPITSSLAAGVCPLSCREARQARLGRLDANHRLKLLETNRPGLSKSDFNSPRSGVGTTQLNRRGP